MAKPVRVTVLHHRSATGADLFSVCDNAAIARHVAAQAPVGAVLISSSARFDFTLQQWGLSLNARFVSCPTAARALANAKPQAPRAPRAAGQAPGRKRGGPVFGAKPDATALAAEALAKIEDLLVVKAAANGVSKELEKEFEKYQKLKALALGRGTTAGEASTAMRMTLISAIKLVF
jgi:hypothetical protein